MEWEAVRFEARAFTPRDIASVVSAFRAVEKLDLFDCNFGEDHFKALQCALRHNNVLRTLRTNDAIPPWLHLPNVLHLQCCFANYDEFFGKWHSKKKKMTESHILLTDDLRVPTSHIVALRHGCLIPGYYIIMQRDVLVNDIYYHPFYALTLENYKRLQVELQHVLVRVNEFLHVNRAHITFLGKEPYFWCCGHITPCMRLGAVTTSFLIPFGYVALTDNEYEFLKDTVDRRKHK